MKTTLTLLTAIGMMASANGASILLGGFDGNQTEAGGPPKTLSGAVQDATAVGNFTVTLSTSATIVGFDWAAGFQSSNANWGLQSFLPAANTTNNNAVYAADATPALISMILTNTGSLDVDLDSIHMRIKRDGTGSPTVLRLAYASGAALAGTNFAFDINSGGATQHDFALSNVLSDNRLEAGQSATLTWITEGGTGQRTRFDNIAISGEFVAAVPEPSSMALLGLGFACLLLRRRR